MRIINRKFTKGRNTASQSFGTAYSFRLLANFNVVNFLCIKIFRFILHFFLYFFLLLLNLESYFFSIPTRNTYRALVLWEYKLVTFQESSLSVCLKKPKDIIIFLEIHPKEIITDAYSGLYKNVHHSVIYTAKNLKLH